MSYIIVCYSITSRPEDWDGATLLIRSVRCNQQAPGHACVVYNNNNDDNTNSVNDTNHSDNNNHNSNSNNDNC